MEKLQQEGQAARSSPRRTPWETPNSYVNPGASSVTPRMRSGVIGVMGDVAKVAVTQSEATTDSNSRLLFVMSSQRLSAVVWWRRRCVTPRDNSWQQQVCGVSTSQTITIHKMCIHLKCMSRAARILEVQQEQHTVRTDVELENTVPDGASAKPL